MKISVRGKMFSLIVFSLITCASWLGIIMIGYTTEAAPIVTGEAKEGTWFDTYNDTMGMYDMNNVTVNETRTDVTLVGYWNNFDTDTLGPIYGWTYEVLGNPMQHHVIEDPYESGRGLRISRNDNLAAYDEHRLWIEFQTYYEILDFDLTPWSIEGVNRQGYFYIEFYNITNDEIHEVRYYWDDSRSGTPASTSTLTAIDLGWVLPGGPPGAPGDVRFYLHENISEDIDINPSADLTNILFNTTNVRYGFYQDAGPDWVQVDQVIIDNFGIHPPINKGNFTSTKITCPMGFGWNNLTVNKTEPGTGNYINFTILDGSTFEIIDGFADLTGSVIDLSSINSTDHPTIRLLSNFTGNGSATPVLHDLTVNWIQVPPAPPKGLAVNNPWTGYSLILSWHSNLEPDMERYVLYYSTDNVTFYWLTNISADTISFIHYGLTMGATYYYKIAAADYVPYQSNFSYVVNGTPDLDTDNDGIGNDADPDDDNDGLPDDIDPYPMNPLNNLTITLYYINNTVNDIQNRVIEIQLDLDNMNISLKELQDTMDYLNQTLTLKIDNLITQLTGVNDSLMGRISDLETNILADLQSVNTSLYNEIRNLLTNITNDIAEMMTSLSMLEANLTAQHDTINDTMNLLSDLVSNEHALTRSEILDKLNNSLALLQSLDTNMTTHDIDIKSILAALDTLIQNENNLTRSQLIDNVTEILNQLQMVDQGILNEIAGMNNSISGQLTSLFENMTTDHDALRDWLEIVLAAIDTNLTSTNNTLHQELNALDTAIANFYDNLTDDIGNIEDDLQDHDDLTGQNHSHQIDLLNQLLDGQIEKEKIVELRTFLIELAHDLSEHNQSIANDIMGVVNDIDEFEVETGAQLEKINKTLEDLAKLKEILDDLKALDQSLDQAEEDIQDSIDERSTKDEDEDRFFVIELFLIILFILIIVNMILTVLMGKRKKEEGPPAVYQPPLGERPQQPIPPPPASEEKEPTGE